jgi:hypothetical protein
MEVSLFWSLWRVTDAPQPTLNGSGSKELEMTTSRCTVVLVAAFALLTASHAFAAGATYSSKGFTCVQSTTFRGGMVTPNFPSLTSSTGYVENVYFLAMLYRYQNGAWQPYKQLPTTALSANPTTWYRGTVSAAGPSIIGGTMAFPSYWAVGNTFVINPGVFSVPPGYYVVREFYRWASGVRGDTYGKYQTPQGPQPYCLIQ